MANTYLQYKFRAIQDFNATKNQDRLEVGQVRGSAILGAIVNNYLKAHGLKDLDETSKKDDILAMKVSDATLCVCGKKSIPKPGVAKEEKDLTYLVLGDNDMAVQAKMVRHAYLSVSNKDVINISALAKNQQLVGYIEVNASLVEELKEILIGKEIYLGFAKNIGFGKCIFESLEEVSKDTILNTYINYNQGKEDLVVVATSDILMTEEDFKNTVVNVLGNATEVKSKIELAQLELFNRKFNKRCVETVIARGSYVIYNVKNLDTSKVEDLVLNAVGATSIGDVNLYGYGQLAVISGFNNRKFKGVAIKPRITQTALSSSDKAELNKILQAVYKVKVNNAITNAITELVAPLNVNVINSCKSQLGSLYTVITNLQFESEETGVAKLEGYIGHTIQNKGTASASKRALDRVRVNGQPLTDVCLSVIKGDVTELSKYIALPTLNNAEGKPFTLTQQDLYNYKLNFVGSLLRTMLTLKKGV